MSPMAWMRALKEGAAILCSYRTARWRSLPHTRHRSATSARAHSDAITCFVYVKPARQ